MVNVNDLRTLRLQTGAGLFFCKRALEECDGDMALAEAKLREDGHARVVAREDRDTPQGHVESYVHGEGRLGVLVALRCETDFVARTDVFRALGHGLAMHIAAFAPRDVKELLEQTYALDETRVVRDVIAGVSARTGETIRVGQFTRIHIN